MNPNDVLKLTDQAIETWNQHDVNKFLTFCEDNIVVNELGVAEPHKGTYGARDFVNNWISAFPDFKIKRLNTVASEDSIAYELEFTGTNTGPLKMGDAPGIPATKIKVTSKGSCFGKVKNGKFTEINAYPDLAGMLMQLDVLNEIHA